MRLLRSLNGPRAVVVIAVGALALAACFEKIVDVGCPGNAPFRVGDQCYVTEPDGFVPPDGFMFPDMSKVPNGSCMSSVDCADATPICSAQTCRVCMSSADDFECAHHNAATPFCDTPSGACVQCRTSMDCANPTPACGTDHSCRKCEANSECSTGVCKPDGTCALSNEIVNVNNKTGCSNVTGNPYCDIQPALMAAKPYVVVAGSATPYAAVSLSVTALMQQVTVVGPGRTAMPTAVISQSGSPAVSLSTSTALASANITFDGFEMIGSNGATKSPGVSCAATAGTATLVIKNSSIHDSGSYGVDSSSCTLTLDSNLIGPSNGGGGVRFASSTAATYTITNNIIFNNTGTGVIGVRIDDSPTGSVFAFNTVAGNGAATPGAAGGIVCNSAANIQASIVVGNSLTAATGGSQFGGGATCQLSNVVTGPDSAPGAIMMTPAFVSTSNYRLNVSDATSTTTNKACCIDKLASPSTPNANHDIDASARPKGTSATPFDIGAHEAL